MLETSKPLEKGRNRRGKGWKDDDDGRQARSWVKPFKPFRRKSSALALFVWTSIKKGLRTSNYGAKADVITDLGLER